MAYHKLWVMAECSAETLRSANVLATLLTAVVATRCHALIHRQPWSSYSFHTGVNIALFPVIFFFSALYYTDVVSTLAVLFAYQNHLLRVGSKPPGFLNGLWTVVLGVAALSMRQTNVFWVVVYMGGLEAAHAVRSLKPPPFEPPNHPLSFFEHVRFYAWRDSVGDVHDPPLNEAWPEGKTFPLSCLLFIR